MCYYSYVFTLLLKFVRIVLIGCNIYTGGTVFVSFLYHLSNNSTSAGTSRIHSRIMSSSFASIIVGSGRYPYFCPKNTCREMILMNSECFGSVIIFRTWNPLCSFHWLLVPLLVSLRNGFLYFYCYFPRCWTCCTFICWGEGVMFLFFNRMP